MRKFDFRLERVLQLRLQAEQERARRLGEARAAETAAREDAERSAARVAQTGERVAEVTGEHTPAGLVGSLLLTLEAARARALAAAEQHAAMREQLETERTAFDEARQARRALEKLKEKQHGAWTRDVNRKEQAHLDEVALRKPGGRDA